jgi:hypothetical protein
LDDQVQTDRLGELKIRGVGKDPFSPNDDANAASCGFSQAFQQFDGG